MKLKVKEVVQICHGELFCGNENAIISSYSKDTRDIKAGDIYIGIYGTNFDGNSFYKEAFEKGASGAILEKKYFKEDKNYNYTLPIILVDNSILALKDLADYVRSKSDATFVGVTGSVGKTSTKDMIASVLSMNYDTLKTDGNYNNNIGVPLTILRLNDEKMAVIEMGMNNLGEIDYLTKITKPHISVITNVGTAHIGNLGSRENILKAKLEIRNGMDEKGILVINNDNDMLHKYYLSNQKNIITVGINNESDIMATNIEIKDTYSNFDIKYQNNNYRCHVNIPGEVFIYNSLISFAIGVLTNVDIDKIIKGINDFKLTKDRMEILILKNNITLINDAYNANVDSMKSSLCVLSKTNSKRKIAVLGSMLELGDFAQSLHESVGESFYNNKIDILITVGEEAKYIASKVRNLGKEDNIYSFDNNEDAIKLLDNILKENDAILLKASNGLHFKEISDYLKNK